MIEKHGNEVIAPIVIDTPNQHEQSIKNYNSIIKIITEKLSAKTQVIVCAMDNDLLEPYESKPSIIE